MSYNLHGLALFGTNNLPLPSRDVAYVLDISDANNLVWKNVTNTLIQNFGPMDRYLRFHHNGKYYVILCYKKPFNSLLLVISHLAQFKSVYPLWWQQWWPPTRFLYY